MTWTRSEEQRTHPPDKPQCHRLPTCSQRLWPRFDQYLQERNLDPDLARKNLWFPSRTVDGYDRLVVPGTSDQTGNLYWQARLIQDDPGIQTTSGRVFARRWESPHGISRGNSVCLVWPREAGPGRPTAVVEGPMDALAAAGEGFVSVALMGVQPPADCLSLTAKLLRGTIPVIVSDLNAEKEMTDVQLRLAAQGIVGQLCSPYPGKDLAALDRPGRRKVLGL